MTDTQRLHWIVEKILLSNDTSVLHLLGITEEDLTGPGDVTLGILFNRALDRNIRKDMKTKEEKLPTVSPAMERVAQILAIRLQKNFLITDLKGCEIISFEELTAALVEALNISIE